MTDDAKSGEHFPWHYTEFGVICVCGAAMTIDERCPADESPCIAPPGNLCTETGCWDADRCIVDPICNERGVPQSECPPHCRHDDREG